MRWFKLLNSSSGDVVGAEEHAEPVFVYRQKNGVIIIGDEILAQGVVSADGAQIYQLGGKNPLNDPGVTLTAVEIYGTEYDEIIRCLPDPEDEEPEILDDPGSDGEKPMTRAELTAKVVEQEGTIQEQADTIQMLTECLLEMSEIVYGE